MHELAHASGVCVRVDREALLWFEPGIAVCRALGADPWSTLASGTLLAAFPAETAEAALPALAGRGRSAAVIGSAERGSGVCDSDGDPILWPARDEVARLVSAVTSVAEVRLS